MNLFFACSICLLLGIVIGCMVENYRARVMWGFPLGTEWSPPRKQR